MNHPRDPKALHAFSYDPTVAEVAIYTERNAGVAVTRQDVLDAARAIGRGYVRNGRVSRTDVPILAPAAGRCARARAVRAAQTRSIADQVWEQSAYGPQATLVVKHNPSDTVTL